MKPDDLNREEDTASLAALNSGRAGAGFAPVTGSASRWVTDTLPESDMTVLIRCSGDEYPVWPGFHDGEQWCSADGSTLEGPVLGWMELETAAEVLDGK